MAQDKTGLVIIGTDEADELIGTRGNDIIDGHGGADRLVGGFGDDIYLVENTGDVVVERRGHGTDEVLAMINYTLVANVENLTLLGTTALGRGNSLDNVITGNASNNTLRGFAGNDSLFGNDGNDTLNGGTGADLLDGGNGNDSYFVDNLLDVVIELADGGRDRVLSLVDFELPAQVENLTLVGTAVNGTGTGNALANSILGNASDNTLDGREGNDVINGRGGADTMIGGTGNDIFHVDNALDSVVELAGEGWDRVISWVDYELPANVESLTLRGAAVSGSGNELNNNVTGTGASNLISGLGGNDVLRGLGGSDTLDGGSGNDRLYGGAGNDTLTGGDGADRFFFDTSLNQTSNVDSIVDFSEGDMIGLGQAIFSGLDTGNLDASAFHAGTAAADADDRIIYDSATGAIYYDSDGDGAAAARLFAYVTPGTDLGADDFFVVG